jgi:hypothetical protein
MEGQGAQCGARNTTRTRLNAVVLVVVAGGGRLCTQWRIPHQQPALVPEKRTERCPNLDGHIGSAPFPSNHLPEGAWVARSNNVRGKSTVCRKTQATGQVHIASQGVCPRCATNRANQCLMMSCVWHSQQPQRQQRQQQQPRQQRTKQQWHDTTPVAATPVAATPVAATPVAATETATAKPDLGPGTLGGIRWMPHQVRGP